MSPDSAERLLARLVVNASSTTVSPPDDLFECAVEHRLDRVFAARLLPRESIAASATGADLQRRLREAAVLEMVRLTDLVRLTRACAAEGLRPILFKGDAIAYSLYAEPYLRPRSDSDLLIHPQDRRRAEDVLRTNGYRADTESVGEHNAFQSHWTSAPASGPAHAVDLHWRLFNAEPFAHVLEVADVEATAAAVPALGHALVPSLEHQCLITAVHRVAHHYDAGHLLWLFDLHLLAGALGESGQRRVCDLALARGVGAVLARGLARAEDAFGTALAADVRARLSAAPTPAPMRIFLEGRPRQVDVLRANMIALSGWSSRAALMRDHLFPARTYVRAIYPGWPRLLLGLAYLHRIVTGAPKWFRRPDP